MAKIPLLYSDGDFFHDFGTTCYINREQMVEDFPLYRHNFIEVSLVLSGEGTEVINCIEYPVKK